MSRTSERSHEPPTTARVVVPLSGFTCPGSEARVVERAIERLPGVVGAYVNAATEAAYVVYDPAVCTIREIAEAVRRVGVTPETPIER